MSGRERSARPSDLAEALCNRLGAGTDKSAIAEVASELKVAKRQVYETAARL